MRFVGRARFYWRICSSFGGSDEEYNYLEAAVMTERKSSRASKMFSVHFPHGLSRCLGKIPAFSPSLWPSTECQSFHVTTFVTRNSSIPLDELNRPHPLFLTPPIGNAGSSRMVMLLMWTALMIAMYELAVLSQSDCREGKRLMSWDSEKGAF